jgi:transposase-like protein
MKRPNCPDENCIGESVKNGYFKTKWNAQPVPRYLCKECGRDFSSHTRRATFGQHRPDLNQAVYDLYASGMTQRRMAQVLRVDRKTIVRKFLFLARLAREAHEERIAQGQIQSSCIHFDEMETFEHTRLKPVSVALGVRAKSGEIVDIKVAKLGYKGPLAWLARKKYGPREDLSHQAIEKVLASVAMCARNNLTLVTDSNTRYPRHVARSLPEATHIKTKLTPPDTKSDRRNLHDPLFTLNYTAAKIRNDLSRMSRKTWVTTKKIERLQAHMDLYIAWNNRYPLPVAA